MEIVDKEVIKLKLENFLLKYGSKYGEDILNYINENFWTEIDYNCAPDILMQLYSELGVYEGRKNFYSEHLENIKKNFNINGNVLDIASGCIPAFGNLIAKEQLKLGSGTVTLYEPCLIIDKTKYNNMKMYKTKFTTKVDVSKYDLITGLLPCEVTEDIIESACVNKKNFYVAMCGCVHSDFIGGYGMMYDVSPHYYQEYIINVAMDLLKKYDNGKLVIEKLDDSFSIDYPILYNKK